MSFSSGTFSLVAGNPVVTGTTISSTWANNTLSDIATGLSTCVLKDGTQTTTAPVTFAAGINFTSVAGTSFITGTTSSTFTFNGSGGTTSAVTISWQKIANWVTLHIPAVSGTSGTSSTLLASNTALAAAVRPASATQTSRVSSILNNGAGVGPSGYLEITAAGIINIQRDAIATAFTNTATAGTSTAFSFTYFVG